MSKAIWKYQLARGEFVTTFDVPDGAKILTAQVQHGEIVLWAEVDPEQQQILSRTVYVVQTGEHVPEGAKVYLATVQLYGGDIILHIYTDAAPTPASEHVEHEGAA